jgi:hypothetical protein
MSRTPLFNFYPINKKSGRLGHFLVQPFHESFWCQKRKYFYVVFKLYDKAGNEISEIES